MNGVINGRGFQDLTIGVSKGVERPAKEGGMPHKDDYGVWSIRLNRKAAAVSSTAAA